MLALVATAALLGPLFSGIIVVQAGHATISAIVLGHVIALSLHYFATWMAALRVRGYAAYLVFLPLAFCSAAVGGWIVRRAFPRPMVVIVAGSSIIGSVITFVVCAALDVFHRMPTPVLAYFVAVDFLVGPLGMLVGGCWDSSRADDALLQHTSERL